MNFLSLKHKLFRYQLNKKLKNQTIVRKVFNIHQAKYVGILFNATNPEEVVIINKFAKSLQKQDVKVNLLGFFNTTGTPTNVAFPFFTRKHLNWYGVPTNSHIDDFKNKRFDILINAYTKNSLPLEYISSLSNAKFRVGKYFRGVTHSNDMMVQVEDNNLNTCISKIKAFLEEINKDAKAI